MEKYKLGYRVKSHIKRAAYDSDLGGLNFKCNDCTIEFPVFENKQTDPKIIISIFLEAENGVTAASKGADTLSDFLDVVSYIFQASFSLHSLAFILKAEEGSENRVVMRLSFDDSTRKTIYRFKNDEYKKSIDKILDNFYSNPASLSLKWLSKAYLQGSPETKFTYAWLGIERYIGEKGIISKCSVCGHEKKYSGIDKDGIRHLISSTDSTIDDDRFEKIWRFRNIIFHGGKKIKQDEKEALREITVKIIRILEQVCDNSFLPKVVDRTSGTSHPSDSTFDCAFFKFKTSTPEKDFVDDFPADDDIFKIGFGKTSGGIESLDDKLLRGVW